VDGECKFRKTNPKFTFFGGEIAVCSTGFSAKQEYSEELAKVNNSSAQRTPTH